MLELSRKIDRRAIETRELVIGGESLQDEDRRRQDRESGFAELYAAEAEALWSAMFAAASRERDWQRGVRAGLRTLLRFAAERPAVADALFREVHVVGGAALAKREEMVERLAGTLESSCPRRDAAGPGPARFVLGAVEGVIAGHLARGQAQRLPGIAPELMRFIVASFLGIEAVTAQLPVDA